MKKAISLLVILSMMLVIVPVSSAATSLEAMNAANALYETVDRVNHDRVETQAMNAASALYEMGLFQGTGTDADGSPIFDLDRAPTRAEAVTMLVRLLGKETDARAGAWDIPFDDVADWARPYVGYAYQNALTNGVSGTAFGTDSEVTASQYITFVLRALGYLSGVDFQWDRAWELSDEIGLTSRQYNETTRNFTRGDVAMISYNALDQTLKNSTIRLIDTLTVAQPSDASNPSTGPTVPTGVSEPQQAGTEPQPSGTQEPQPSGGAQEPQQSGGQEPQPVLEPEPQQNNTTPANSQNDPMQQSSTQPAPPEAPTDGPTPDGPTPSGPFGAAESAVDYLISLAEEHAPSGTYIFHRQNDGETEYAFGLHASGNAAELSVLHKNLSNGSQNLSTITLTKEITAPFIGAMIFTIGDTNITGVLAVRPAEYARDAELSFSSYDGGADYEALLASLYSSSLTLLLTQTNSSLLAPNGYTLADLGFTAFR